MKELKNSLTEIKGKYLDYKKRLNETQNKADAFLLKMRKKYGVKLSFFDIMFKEELNEAIKESYEHLEALYAGEPIYGYIDEDKEIDPEWDFGEKKEYPEIYKKIQANSNGVEEYVEQKLGKEALILFNPEPSPVEKPSQRFVWLVGGLALFFLGIPLLIGVGKFLSITLKLKAYKNYHAIKNELGDAFNKCLTEYKGEEVGTLEDAKKEINEALNNAKKTLEYDKFKAEENQLEKELHTLIKIDIDLSEIDKFIGFINNSNSLDDAIEQYNKAEALARAIEEEIDRQCYACKHRNQCNLRRRNCSAFVPR